MSIVVKVDNLTKSYGDLTAVNNISFSIEQGEIFGLLGPNGAGKTTTVEMMEGLRKPDSGSIEICGIDAINKPGKIKEIIGAQLQSTTIYDQIRVKEVIDLFGSYYKKSLPSAELLEEVSLTDKENAFYRTLSGGQKQRVAMALAIVNDPEVLFLDEPTTGLDPQARRNVWSIISNLRKRGKTIILTTHYMEEAEQLCQRVGIIDHGKIIAIDTTGNLILNAGLESAIEFSSSKEDVEKIIKGIIGIGKITEQGNNSFILNTKESSKALKDLTRFSDENNISMDNISVRKATLEDVFLLLTGRRLRE
ncbi:MAG: ABC transporter ATP-binding protein [Actinobacteria bacterium]|jgi:ABC-2 type transport system ATP-binding protein|nr:ABC transporter ATP-binding protein [Actinomycetota bacterium]